MIENRTRERSLLNTFAIYATKIAVFVTALILALAVIVIWAFTWQLFGISGSWQVILNIGTTVITLLMFFFLFQT